MFDSTRDTPRKRICPAADFPELGSDFPYTGPVTVQGVRKNIQYTIKELVRFERSVSVVCGCELHGHTEVAPIVEVLNLLALQLDEANKENINAILPTVFPHLRPWTGAVLDNGLEMKPIHHFILKAVVSLTGPFLRGDIGTGNLTPDQLVTLQVAEEASLGSVMSGDELRARIKAREPKPKPKRRGSLISRMLNKGHAKKPTPGSIIFSE